MAANHFTREELAQYILHSAEDEVIAKFNAVLEEEKTEEIVAYTTRGEPLTKAKYIQQIKDAEKRIENGQFTTHEDLMKEAKNW